MHVNILFKLKIVLKNGEPKILRKSIAFRLKPTSLSTTDIQKKHKFYPTEKP